MDNWSIVKNDLLILRDLGARIRDLSQHPDNVERRASWYALDGGHAVRPMMLCESWVAFDELSASTTVCQEEWAQVLERSLRFEIFQFESIRDDHVIEPYISHNWRVSAGDYGVVTKQIYAERVSGNVSSRKWEPPLLDLARDLPRLRSRSFSVDRETTEAWGLHLREVFGGILEVRLRGGFWWTTGLTQTAIDLMGLEPFMMAMCEQPDALHALMAFLRDDQLAYAEWLEREGLLTLNNENDYIGSGSMGYTRSLPTEGYKDGSPVRLKDLWVLSESQETVSVAPSQFEEFTFPYQLPITERFGRLYYGCCEPVHTRWHILKRFPNLARVSVSPWCDEEYMADALGRDYVYSRKPNPTLVSTSDFDEDLIRKDLRQTLAIARQCNVEIVMKDVHTLSGEPNRLARWVELAREEAAG